MNTNDLIKTAQYLDKLGSYKIADKVENKLVRLAAAKLIVDPAIRNEYNAIKKLLEKFNKGDPPASDSYNTSIWYGSAPYVKGHYNVKMTIGDLTKRLIFITSTEFIKGFNLKRASYLENDIDTEVARNVAKRLRENANSGATSPFLPEQPSKGTGKPSGKTGSGKPSAPGKAPAPGRASVIVKPSGSGIGSSGLSGGAAVSAGPPTAPNSTTNSAPPASPEEGKSSLISLLDELDSITANENVWKANVNTVIPKLRKANTLFTQIYDSLSIKEARLLGNRLDMITLANTTFTGRFSGMR